MKFFDRTPAVLLGGVAEVSGTTSLAAKSLGMVETFEALSGLLVTASRHAVVDVVVAAAAFTRAARNQRIAVVVLGTSVAAYACRT